MAPRGGNMLDMSTMEGLTHSTCLPGVSLLRLLMRQGFHLKFKLYNTLILTLSFSCFLFVVVAFGVLLHHILPLYLRKMGGYIYWSVEDAYHSKWEVQAL